MRPSSNILAMFAFLGMGAFGTACGSSSDCATDADCPTSQRCVNSGGLFWNGGACVAAQRQPADAGPFLGRSPEMTQSTSSDTTAPPADTTAPPNDTSAPPDVSTKDDDLADMTPDATPDMHVPMCECLQPDDDCSSSGDRNPSSGGTGVCIGEVCNIDTPCDTGYDCKSQGGEYRCECIDPLECGVACETDAECGYSRDVARCSSAHGVCLPETTCLQDRHCADGELCALSSFSNGACRTSGDLPIGEPCTQHQDCATATCITNICVTPCRRNRDCGGDKLCVRPQGSIQGACTASASAPCLDDCTGPDLVCTSEGACETVENFCEPGTCDPETRCTITRSLGTPTCRQGQACGPTEYALEQNDGTIWCSELDPCWEDADCPGGSCVIIHRTDVGGVTLSDVRRGEYLPVCATMQ